MANATYQTKLAILPNGEAIDPSNVKAVLIEPGLGLATDMNERFDVCILFHNEATRSIAKGVVREEAERISRHCARAINEARSANNDR